MTFVAAAGKVLDGRYLLVAPLGQGGMGMVWRAQHTQLKTAVAVKFVVPTMFASEEAHARFRREAQVAAALESPNIVRVLDFGVEDGTPFLVMELLQGETLGARIARAALSPAATAAVVAQIARGSGCAHQANVVHCDLKPENVFLAKIDGEEIAKVLDFGIARAPAFDPVTMTGAVLGTLQYMSPEQLENRKGVDARSDLYSLAVIAFECLSGRQLFKADSIAELVRKICIEPLPVPSEIARVPSGFDAWFSRAAHRAPSSRYASAREMSEALTSVLTGKSASTSTSGPARDERERATPAFALDATQSSSRLGGTERAGFRVTPNLRTRILELEFWGLWDLELAHSWREAVDRASDEMAGAPWLAMSIASRHPPQMDEIQALKQGSMSRSVSLGLRRAAIVIADNAVSKMQLRRLAAAGGLPDARIFTNVEEARAWLADADMSSAPKGAPKIRPG